MASAALRIGGRPVTRRVHRIVELRGAGELFRSIASTLDAEGHRPRRATAWSAMAVRNIVQRHAG